MSTNKTTRSYKKPIWISAIIILLSLAVYFFFIRKADKEVVVQYDPVMRETLTNKVSATGTINPIEAVEVGTQVSGTIDELLVDFNDKVETGQVIAKMDTRNLIASKKESEANLLRAKVQLQQAERNLKRTTELYKEDFVAKVEMENAEDDYQLAQANYNSAKLQLERNQVNLDYATIRSPIDGIVISRKVEEGQTVAATFTTPAIYVIANDLKQMKIEASVDEADIGQVKPGQVAEFTVDAYPDDTFYGTVEQIQLQPVTIQNVVTYTVEIIVENKDLKLMPGMTATLEIIIASMEDVLTIPNGVFSFSMDDELAEEIRQEEHTVIYAQSDAGETLWKQQGNSFIEVPVNAGYSNGIKTEISGDFEEGDKLVSSIELIAGGKKKPARNIFMPPQDDDKKSGKEDE